MKILFTVESYYPITCGMSEVTQQLSENLVKLGHNVTVATSNPGNALLENEIVKGVKIVRFTISGNNVNGIAGDVICYQNFLTNNNFDIVTNFAAQQWATDLCFPVLEKIKAKKVFVPTGFSALYDFRYKNYFKNLEITIKNYDANVFLSNDYRDIQFAQKNKAKNISIIPNGASEAEFTSPYSDKFIRQLGITDSDNVIVLVGSHTGLKGHADAIKIFQKAKLNNSVLIIIAKNSNSICNIRCKASAYLINKMNIINNNRIIVLDTNRKNTVNILKRANLMLFTSNIECSPIVLFESAASKTPFLVTDVGNSREIIKWLKSGQLLPTVISKEGFSFAKIDESSKILNKLMNNKHELETMAKRGYKEWIKDFTWEKIAKKYEKLYLSLME